MMNRFKNFIKKNKKKVNDSTFFSKRGLIESRSNSGSFFVKFDNGEIVTATVSTKIRGRKKNMVAGDIVIVNISVNDLSKGQIIQLLEK